MTSSSASSVEVCRSFASSIVRANWFRRWIKYSLWTKLSMGDPRRAHSPRLESLWLLYGAVQLKCNDLVRTASKQEAAILLDSVSVKAHPKNNRDTNAKRSGFQSGESLCRRLKKAIRKIRNRRRTKTSLRPMCRPTRRRKARASPPAVRSRKRPDARFSLK